MALVVATLGLSACATLNESQCRSADWYLLGTRDGADGYGGGRLESHREACAEFGLAADEAAWRKGYEDGLQTYCTADNGYQVGRRGGAYGRVCPADSERDFVEAYDLGRETREVEQELVQVRQRIDAIEYRLVNEKLEDAARYDLRRQLSEYYRQSSWLRRSLERLESEWRRRY